MANPIKYSTGSETLALKKGNFYIGTGAVGKGPTSETGYYNGITPPSGGYTIYLNKASGGPSIYTASNDAQLISLTNQIAGTSYTTATQCFNYYYGQTDKLLVNQDYPTDFPYIVMDGLVLYLDAGITQSYSSSGTTWSDINGLGPKNTGTLTNGPTFSGGSIVFDGMNDYVIIPTSFGSEGSICCWVYPKDTNDNFFVYSTNNTTSEYSHKLGITTNNKLNAYLWPANPTSFDGTDFMATNRWHYCVFWWKNGVGYGSYLNSTSQGTGSISSAWSSGYNLFVGSNSGGPAAGYLNGNVSVIQTYQRALTESEVLQNYNAQKGRFGL